MDYDVNYKYFLNDVEVRINELIPVQEPNELYEPFRYIMEGGGKRIRPVLTMLACGAVNNDPYYALDAGAAIEIVHNFTLVHDDIMDNSPIRRGRETIHQKWNSAIGILTGDTMVAYAYKILYKYKDNKNYPEMIDALTDSILEVCHGQAYDMNFNTNQDIGFKEYYQMIGLKTAALLQGCVRLGAAAAGASKEEYEILNDYAYLLGIAFQIQDDVLDILADQTKLGKQIGQDIMEGKKSYIILKAKELVSDDDDKKIIAQFFQENGLDSSFIPIMRQIMDKAGVFTAAQNEIDTLLSNANSAIAKLKQNDYTQMLIHLNNSLNKRKF